MDNTELDQAVDAYCTALDNLLREGEAASAKHVFNVLAARSAVQALLAMMPDSHEALVAILPFDNRLRRAARLISSRPELPGWRDLVQPADTAWWWRLETPARNDRTWLWRGLSLISLAVAASLAVDTSTRFFGAGPDTLSVFAVVSQSLLAVLTTGGALTQTGRRAIEQVFALQPTRRPFWFGISLVLLLLLVAFRLSLPLIAVFYNNRGLEHHLAGQLSSARSDYQRALRLNPDYAEAHYNLGLLYEDLNNYDAARLEYEVARQSGLDVAYNNLARLYILNQEYSQAVALLSDGLLIVQDDITRYHMLKNLGWARLGQRRFTEAEAHLQAAIAIDANQAATHCLLAQVYEHTEKSQAALDEWETCLQFASSRYLDEDIWIGQARQALAEQGAP